MPTPDRPVTIAAAIITRDRPDLLRRTLLSLGESTYPLLQIVVSDDGMGDDTADMLASEFPVVTRIRGPRRGISANRNCAIRACSADYVLVLDDDVVIDRNFCRIALERAKQTPECLLFSPLSENGHVVFPNGLDFLGFLTKPYEVNTPYHTAHAGCFILAKSITKSVMFDEIISTYGFEEVDFTYRVVAAGFTIICIPECVCVHLAPGSSFRPSQEANRLYGTFRRYFDVDGRVLKGIAFLCVAIPHHFLTSVRRGGWQGWVQAWSNTRRAFGMFRRARNSVRYNQPI